MPAKPSTPLGRSIVRYFGLLGSAGVRAARSAAAFWPKVSTYNTMSSGTDMFALVVDPTRKEAPMGLWPVLQHQWSRECAEHAQTFLINQWGSKLWALFDNNANFLNLRTHDIATGSPKQVRHADGLVAGFTCTSRSNANKHSASNIGCIAQAIRSRDAMSRGVKRSATTGLPKAAAPDDSKSGESYKHVTLVLPVVGWVPGSHSHWWSDVDSPRCQQAWVPTRFLVPADYCQQRLTTKLAALQFKQ